MELLIYHQEKNKKKFQINPNLCDGRNDHEEKMNRIDFHNFIHWITNWGIIVDNKKDEYIEITIKWYGLKTWRPDDDDDDDVGETHEDNEMENGD